MTLATNPFARIELATAPDFRLGRLRVSPSQCRVAADGREERVEPRVMQVLIALAEHPGQTVTRDQLIERCWEGRIVSETAVTRVISQLRMLGRSFDPAPYTLETIPKVGLRLLPDDDAGPSPAEAAPSADRPRRAKARTPWLAAALAAALLLAAGVGLWLWSASERAGAGSQNGRVEVSAFTTTHPNPELRRVGERAAQTLVGVLSSGGMQIADAGGAANLDSELRVSGVLDRRGGGDILESRVIDRRSGVVLWSSQFEQPAGQSDALAEMAGRKIAFVLHCALEDRRGATAPLSTQAFSLYLNACASVNAPPGPARMLAVTRRLVKAAPQHAGAHAMHGIAAALAANDAEVRPQDEAALRAEARAAAEQAIRLDPLTAKAYVARELSRADGDLAAREKDLRRALEIDPDLPPQHARYARLLRDVGRLRDSVAVTRQSLRSGDPRNNAGDAGVLTTLAAMGDLQGARTELQSVAPLLPPPVIDSLRWNLDIWWGSDRDRTEALRAPPQDWNQADLPCLRDYFATLRARRAQGLPASCDQVSPERRIRLLGREGDVDGAIAALEARPKTSRRATQFLFYPEMRAVRRDPRFMPLAERLGLVDYWLTSGQWPDFCREPDLPYDCRRAAALAQVGARKATPKS